MRRRGHAEIAHEMAIKHQKKRARQRRAEAIAVIATFCGLAFVIYYGLWMWANGLIGG